MEDKMLDIIVKLYEKPLKLDTNMLRGTKKEKAKSYIEILEEARQRVMVSKDKELEKLFRDFYYDLYVIKVEDIPESVYFEDARIAKERGLGNIEVTEADRKNKAQQIIQDQKESLDKWLDYLLWDEEAKNYSGWEVFWVLEGIQKLGKYDKEKKKYTKRDKQTVYPFPEVEKQAVFNTLGMMEEYLKSKTGEQELKSALGQGNFKALYEYSLEQLSMGKEYTGTEGIWIKYDQGSDYHKLRDSLQGYRTGWCTAAGESFARDQLAGGDFYVYYTKNEDDEYKVPRIAIRMNGHDQIGEVRGVAEKQHMEAEMLPILDEKLKEFPDREKYLKKEHDMAYLTEICKKQEKGLDLTIEDLRFLYEINSTIEGFGWTKDPRIDEIKRKRNIRRDLSIVFGCKMNQIATKYEELNEETIAYCGSLHCCEETIYLPNLKYILKNADFEFLKSAKGLDSLQHIGGNAYFDSLTSADGLENLQKISGDAIFGSLESARGLGSLKYIEGYANFQSLEEAIGLDSLRYIGGDANFDILQSADGLESLEHIKGNAYFESLLDANGLKSLRNIDFNADFEMLEDSKGLESLQCIGYSAYFNSLINSEGLKSLSQILCDADFGMLKSAKGLNSLQRIGGNATFSSLETANGLYNLKTIGGQSFFPALKSLEGLDVLQHIGGEMVSHFISSDEIKNLLDKNLKNEKKQFK